MLYNQNLCIAETFGNADGRNTGEGGCRSKSDESQPAHPFATGRVAVSLDGFLCILVENNLFVLIFGRNVVRVVEHLVRRC